MEDKFSAILFSQESLDGLMDESRFKAAVLKEFSNGEQILKEAERQGFTFGRFRKEGAARLSLSYVPERTAKYFYIKKHTSVQRPYAHTHDFYELIYVHGGRCVQFFGDKKIEMGQGELCIISPETVHCIDRCGKGDIILKAVIPKKMYNACADDIIPKIEGVKALNYLMRTEMPDLLYQSWFQRSLHKTDCTKKLFQVILPCFLHIFAARLKTSKAR